MPFFEIKWQPFWCGLPKFPLEHIFSVDLSSLWRQHVVWSKRDGALLKSLMIQRFASNTVMLTLLISTEIGVFFSPSRPVQEIREYMEKEQSRTLEFYTGIVLCWSVLLSITAFTANFSAWSIISAISDDNVHAVLRSSIGIYAAVLPGRLVLLAVYFFFAWVVMFWWVVIPMDWCVILTTVGLFMLIHVNSTYSALGRVIMHSGAMSQERVFTEREEERMNPQELHRALVFRMKAGKEAKIPVTQQYRMRYRQSLMEQNWYQQSVRNLGLSSIDEEEPSNSSSNGDTSGPESSRNSQRRDE